MANSPNAIKATLTVSELETPHPQEIVRAGDARVSWIYQPRKSELEFEVMKFNFELYGTVEEKLKMLITFVRIGKASTSTGKPNSQNLPPLANIYLLP